jgi:hypothetical protein
VTRPTKEEAAFVRGLLEDHKAGVDAYLFLTIQDFLRRAERSLPSEAAVQRDRQRQRRARSADQTV